MCKTLHEYLCMYFILLLLFCILISSSAAAPVFFKVCYLVNKKSSWGVRKTLYPWIFRAISKLENGERKYSIAPCHRCNPCNCSTTELFCPVGGQPIHSSI